MQTSFRLKRLCAASALACLAATTLHAGAQTTETRRIVPSAGQEGDAYGFSVDVKGNLAVIGAWTDSTLAFQAGAVYIVDTTTGEQLSKFHASDPAFWGGFGTCVDVQGDLLAVGARIGSTFTGAVYLFDISDPTAPVEITTIFASDGAQAEFFGTSVALTGNHLVVGAPSSASLSLLDVGAAYIFDVSDPANPVERFKVYSPFPAGDNEFGINVSAEGNIALVTEWWSGVEDASKVGRAHLFDLTTGEHLSQFAASDGNHEDEFGVWSAISGNIAIVGTRKGDGAVVDSGAAYQFDITNPAAPVEVRKIFPADGVARDEFGRAVDIVGNTILIGANGVDHMGHSASGAAYLFDATTGEQIDKLLATDPAVNNMLGTAVRLSADASTALVTAAGHSSIGAAYVYDLAAAPACPADLDGNSEVDVFDLLAYLDLWFAGDAAAELTNDAPAVIDVFDLLAYLDTWFAGC